MTKIKQASFKMLNIHLLIFVLLVKTIYKWSTLQNKDEEEEEVDEEVEKKKQSIK